MGDVRVQRGAGNSKVDDVNGVPINAVSYERVTVGVSERMVE